MIGAAQYPNNAADCASTAPDCRTPTHRGVEKSRWPYSREVLPYNDAVPARALTCDQLTARLERFRPERAAGRTFDEMTGARDQRQVVRSTLGEALSGVRRVPDAS